MATKRVKKYKVGIDSETYAISMVEQPAIESDFVALSEQKEEKIQAFLESDERHMVYGAALIPDKDIYRNNGEQEFYISFTKESIEKMSQEFMKEYRQNEVTLDHEEMANDITITESWLVEDSYKDKANALGINVPEGTWMVGMKVNQIDVWERVKSGELKGFSVESMISLEEFSKIDNNMIDTNEEMFWDKLKNILKDTFSKKEEEKVEEPVEIEPTNIDLEAEPAPVAEPAPEPEPVVEEPKADPEPAPAPEPEPKPEPQVEPDANKPSYDHLEELIGNLRAEIEALKNTNGELQDKIKDMGKQPSAAPVNVNAKPGAGDTYTAWREQVRRML